MSESDRVWRGATPEEAKRALLKLTDFQAVGMDLQELTDLVKSELEPLLLQYDHPGFLGFFNTVPNEAGRLGARVLTDFNPSVTNWYVSPGGAALEELCARALCRLFELSPEADATFLHAGTRYARS